MVTKEPDKLKRKLVIYRIIVLVLLAFLLVRFNIITNVDGSKNIGLYILALFIALPLTMLLDGYIVRFAKKY